MVLRFSASQPRTKCSPAGTLLLVVGPTASGKSEAALQLAKKLDGEIISCDSMQMYRSMDIGTAKPTQKEQKTVPHHLIDLVKPTQELSVFEYRALALQTIKSILKKGKTPILVGGSGFYVKSLLDGLPPAPGANPALRKKLLALLGKKGAIHLHEKLAQVDPERAKAIHPNDAKRVIRALEIYEDSRQKPSAWLEKVSNLASEGIDFVMLGIERDRDQLNQRIDKRVDQMMRQGWLREVKRLKSKKMSKTARAAIGYAELLAHLSGKMELDEAVEEIKKRTRYLAKKQLTWFRKEDRIHWFRIRGNKIDPTTIQKMIYRFKKMNQKTSRGAR